MEKNKGKIFELHNYLGVEGNSGEVINEIIERVPNLDDVEYTGYLKNS